MEIYVEALLKEIKIQSLKLKKQNAKNSFTPLHPYGLTVSKDLISTIYFGGGTPTLLPVHLLEKIMNAIYENFEVDSEIECTIEGNPEQCSLEYLSTLKKLNFNRISIGIQSFNDEILHFLGRTHSGKDSLLAVENAQKAGFENISVDLIYGIYLRSPQDWKQELTMAFQLPVKHLSAYSLTVEENTLLHKKISQQRILNVDEEQSLQEMNILMKEAKKNGFEHYEVSNFALKNYYSKHNSNYWNGTPYFGFGASAHGFYEKSRSWNIANVDKYIYAIQENKPFFETESLSQIEQYNEYVLLRLRTKNGIDLQQLKTCFGVEKKEYFLQALKKINPQYYNQQSHIVSITKEGLPLLDFITETLFLPQRHERRSTRIGTTARDEV
jgi:oxygen-independent coproporphyrinogen-3 oxidase